MKNDVDDALAFFIVLDYMILIIDEAMNLATDFNTDSNSSFSLAMIQTF
jgi:hypothetical protein